MPPGTSHTATVKEFSVAHNITSPAEAAVRLWLEEQKLRLLHNMPEGMLGSETQRLDMCMATSSAMLESSRRAKHMSTAVLVQKAARKGRRQIDCK